MVTLPGQQHDLHGSAPDTHDTCLLLIDVINDFEFPRGDELFEQAREIAPRIRALKKKAQAAGVPCVYVNDNFGRWRSDFAEIVRQAQRPEARGRSFVQQLEPDEHDYFVLKPKHSAFFQTPLDLLLKHLGAHHVVLAGVSTNSCILFSAGDAYMRDLQLSVPQDCVAACNAFEHDSALRQIETMLKADIRPSTAIDFESLGRDDFTECQAADSVSGEDDSSEVEWISG